MHESISVCQSEIKALVQMQWTCLHAVLLARVELVQHKPPNLHKQPQGKNEHKWEQLAQGLIEEDRPAKALRMLQNEAM